MLCHVLPAFRTGYRRIPLAAGALGLLLASCGGNSDPPTIPRPENRPPVISRVYHNPERIHRNERASVIAVTSDPDNDIIGHIWTADRGSFPNGFGQRVVTWQSPADPGSSNIHVEATDGEYTVRDTMTITTVELEPPREIGFVLGSSVADLVWEESVDEGVDHWAGYEIYRATLPFNEIPEDQLGAYRVAFVPDDVRQIRMANLQRGILYHFALRSLRTWGDTEERSGLGPEVMLSPRPEGISQMNELANPGGSLCLDLSAGANRLLVVSDASGLAERDFYFGTSDPSDGPGLLYLKSVSRLANRNEAWAGRVVRFKLLGTSWTVNTVEDAGWSEEIRAEVDHVFAVLLPEGNYAKIQITGLEGTHPYRQVQLRWAYQTIPDFPVF